MVDLLPNVPVTLEEIEALLLPRFDWSTLGIGPCAGCGREHRRYGEGGSPLCPACEPASSQGLD